MQYKSENSLTKRFIKIPFLKYVFGFLPLLVVIMCTDVSAQLRPEIEEKKTDRIDLESLEREASQSKKEEKDYKLISVLELISSYESNPRLLSSRDGDAAGRLRYSLLFKRKLPTGWIFNFNYNFDGTGYSEVNDLSNLLNRTRFSLDRSLNKFIGMGVGYDFSSFYYPEEQINDYYFHKAFFYLKHRFTKKIYQRVMLEEGVKDYPHSPALLDSFSTFLDVDRRDYRHAAEYSLGVSLTDKLFFRFSTKYSFNDSNALYQDYYDYSSLDFSPYVSYKISDKYSISLSASVSDQEYKNRLVALQSYERKDDIYGGNVGLRYNATENSTLSLGYGYNQSHSNEPSAEYINNTASCGWKYKF